MWYLSLIVLASIMPGTQAQDAKPMKRYGVEPDVLTYPQTTPKDALASALKAIEAGRINYLLAQLADPAWVDQRVKEAHDGRFEALVQETTGKLNNDRASIKELQRFLLEGTWESSDTAATAQVKDLPTRRVYMRKIHGRWFLESRQTPIDSKEK
jgi:hypothetical protein